MHKAIIPVIATVLGPGAVAASIVLAVLEGLSEIDRSTPWVTVFDRFSQHGHGAKFQVSYVDANSQGEPEITLACFGIKADQTITQVLFFNFRREDVELKTAKGFMTVNMHRLNTVKDKIAERITPFVAEYIAKVEI
jgi:hypothetical protein